MMFSSSSHSNYTPVGTIDELEVDHVPTMDDYELEGDDDATEFSQRTGSFFPHSIMPNNAPPSPSAEGSIRMEGWLNHTTSSHKIHDPSSSATAAATPPSSSTTSILKHTVSKKKRQTKKKSPRYFVLRGNTLSYYSRRHDVKAKGTFVLTSGCTVGPVVYGSLYDPPSSTMVVAGERQYQLENSPSWTPGNNSAPIAAHDHFNKPKKKNRQFYCVQVTWPINNKPSKDEEVMAKAKAQVAAESEKKAMIEQQSLEHTLDEYTSSTQKNGERSPTSSRAALQRTKSESGSPRKSAQQHTPVPPLQSKPPRLTVDSLPMHLSPPDLDDHHDDSDGINGNGREKLRPAPLLAVRNQAMSTPATTLSGTNVFLNPNVSGSDNNKESSNNSGSMNHETGLHKHYKNQIEKQSRDQQKCAEELQKVMQLLSQKESHQKAKKRVIKGTKIAAVSTAAITAGVLTAGISLAAGLVFVGITAAAGGSGAVVGSKVLDKARGKYHAHRSQKSFHLIIGAGTYEEAMKWKAALEIVVKELVEESIEEGDMGEEWRLKEMKSSEEAGAAVTAEDALTVPSSPRITIALQTISKINENALYDDMAPKWVPIQGGGMALWGILGALGGGGGNLRIYREERSGSPQHPYSSAPWLFSQPTTSAFPTMPRFRSDVGLAGQPFPPFKASIVLKANSLDAFMCLMCSGRMHTDGEVLSDGSRIPVPNSGQIASFRIIETVDDHMDVIHLVFRPVYLFPSWTAPRDFVLYRFWKYDDDGTYQICFDSGQHRDCPPVPGYVRGEMHSVYTIAPLKPKKKRGNTGVGVAATSTKAQAAPALDRSNLMNVVQ